MRAVVLRELGGPEMLRLEDVADPQPGPYDAVVRLAAAALNHRDVWIRRGQYAGIKLPIVLGSDGTGHVAAVGERADRSLLGQPVVINPSLDWGTDDRVQGPGFRILGLPDDGTYAQFVKVPAENVAPVPAHLTTEEAAALPLAGLTAYRAVVTRAGVRSGETVLVTGIGGGVATFALVLAKALNARVFVTSGSDAKLDLARSLGAEGGVNYHSDEWPKQLLAAMGGEGPDVIIDSAGGAGFNKAIELAKPGGRIVSFGATTGPAPTVEIRRVFWKQLSILGSTMGTGNEFQALLTLAAQHQIRPVIDRVFPLAEAAEAHRRMENAEQFGKIVLRVE